METIKRMQPKHIDDFIPLLDMKEPILREVSAIMAKEYGVIPEKNRIYYLSKELQVRLFKKFIKCFLVTIGLVTIPTIW